MLLRSVRQPAVVAALIYVLMFAVYVGFQGKFAVSAYGISILANATMALAFAAMAVSVVMFTGGFDVSVVGVIALANVIAASVQIHTVPGALLLYALIVAIGAVVGLVNGFFVAYVGLQSIAMTLGTMIITSGIALLILDTPGGTVPDVISYGLTDSAGVFPIAGFVIAAGAVLLWALLRRTRLGLQVYAVGQDRAAAQASGINVRRATAAAYVVSGLLAATSGFLLAAQTGTGDPRFDPSMLLLAFAAAAIGGTSFSGGRGSIVGSVIGAGILALMQKTLFVVGVSSFYTGIFQGILMLAAVLIGRFALGTAEE